MTSLNKDAPPDSCFGVTQTMSFIRGLLYETRRMKISQDSVWQGLPRKRRVCYSAGFVDPQRLYHTMMRREIRVRVDQSLAECWPSDKPSPLSPTRRQRLAPTTFLQLR